MEFNEKILQAWLRSNFVLNGQRIVKNVPFNELVIYRYLYQNQDKEMTPSELCSLMFMNKSLMNRTLKSMEEKEMIYQHPNSKDKRQTIVKVNPKGHLLYMNEHIKILDLINRMIDTVGQEKADQILDSLNILATVASKEVLKND